MARTVNRIPYTVRTPKDSEQRDFNHYNWKGIVDDNNVLTVDQETFENAENVYADKHNLLKSRPSLRPFKVSYTDYNGETHILTNIERVWKLDVGTVYKSSYGCKLIQNGELIYDLDNLGGPEFDNFEPISFKRNLILFTDSQPYVINLDDKIVNYGVSALYYVLEKNGKTEPINYLTDGKNIVWEIDDVNDVTDDALGYVYDVIYEDEKILTERPVNNSTDIKEINVLWSENTEIIDIAQDKEKLGSDVILYKSTASEEPVYFVLSSSGRHEITNFTPSGISLDGTVVYGYSVSDDSTTITINFYNISKRTYDAKQFKWTGRYYTVRSIRSLLVYDSSTYGFVLDESMNSSNTERIHLFTPAKSYEVQRDIGLTGDAGTLTKYARAGSYLYYLNDNFYLLEATSYLDNNNLFSRFGFSKLVINGSDCTIENVIPVGDLGKAIGNAYSPHLTYNPKNLKIEEDIVTVNLLNAVTQPTATGYVNFDMCLYTYSINLNDKTSTRKLLVNIKNYGYAKAAYNIFDYTTLESTYCGSFNSLYYIVYDRHYSDLQTYLKGSILYDGERKLNIVTNSDLSDKRYRIGNYIYVNAINDTNSIPHDETHESDVYTNNLKLLNTYIKLSKRTDNPKNNYRYPNLVKQLGDTIVMSIDDTLYINEYAFDEDGFKLYFPHKTEFAKTITNVQYISDTQFAVFFEDEIYYITSGVLDDGTTLYSYEKSKLDIGCTTGSDVITSFDGTYSIFPSKRGLAYLSYQQFVASTDQTATFISDTINERFKAINNGPIKLGKEDYWIYVYKPGNNFLYLLDNRNGSWWYWTFTKNISSLIIDDDIKLLIDGELYECSYSDTDYYDLIGDKEENINWYFESQKLFLNAPNNYKTITNFSLMSVSDLEEPVTVDLLCTTYRDVSDRSRKEFLEYDVDVTRVFAKRLNYSKVVEFKYKLSSDEDTSRQVPLSLSNISIRYKVGGLIK